ETYVGKSFISTGTNDTLEISFGRDKSVAVKRTSVKDFTGKKIIGLNKTETHAWEIEIRNTKKDTIEIVAEDQIPVSSDKEITVEPIDKGNALYDEITGKLYWKMKLAPAEVRKNKFMFSVKYPKDKVIPNL
ncbi:MAG: DUF4139 domain-containing protein, partial [Bacteroidetes bacterium]|nr:DUF4139 domain-containing protein [Bacteroidota bacterium]